jgi:hypothetical protein
MDGYSVSEAASVLGVPIERVWELLARGVLAGAPEGETGMRVFLQPRPASEAPLDPVASRGNGAPEPERELSPFRELLTEFRNLTERYGQALLALGESRGEVAALRSRVDLLEARMDLGLPAAPSAPRARGWWPGAGPYPSEERIVPAEPSRSGSAEEEHTETEPAAPEEHADAEHAEAEEHRARARGPRRATESFAEAIARAQDPSLPELPEDEIPTAAPVEAREPMTDAALPHESAAAAFVPVADEFGPEDEQPTAAEAPSVEPPTAPDEEPVVDVPADVTADVAPPASADEGASAPAVEAPAAPVDEPPPAFETAAPLEWDAERYTTAIEEPDWFEAEPEAEIPEAEIVEEAVAATEPEPEVVAPEPSAVEPEPEPTAEAEPAVDLAPAAEASAPEVEPAEPEPTEKPEALPGANDLQSAMEALGVGRSEQGDEPVPPRASPPPMAPPVIPGPDPVSSGQAAGATAPPLPESALRYRPVAPTGPTGRAYRRLRRIFPS